MNTPERNIVRLALCLFILGTVVRFLPWGLPAIDRFQVGDAVIVAAEKSADSFDDLAIPKREDVLRMDSSVVLSFVDKVTEEPRGKSKKGSKSASKVSLPVHINSASINELCALKGVGPKLAEKIISVREASGPFKSGEDLKKVPGIGKKKLQSLLLGVIFD